MNKEYNPFDPKHASHPEILYMTEKEIENYEKFLFKEAENAPVEKEYAIKKVEEKIAQIRALSGKINVRNSYLLSRYRLVKEKITIDTPEEKYESRVQTLFCNISEAIPQQDAYTVCKEVLEITEDPFVKEVLQYVVEKKDAHKEYMGALKSVIDKGYANEEDRELLSLKR